MVSDQTRANRRAAGRKAAAAAKARKAHLTPLENAHAHLVDRMAGAAALQGTRPVITSVEQILARLRAAQAAWQA